MIRKLIEKRIEVLIGRIEKLAEDMAEHQTRKENSLSVIEQASAGVIPPQMLKKLRSIQNEIIMLKSIIGADK